MRDASAWMVKPESGVVGMIMKPEAEKCIRHLCHEWQRAEQPTAAQLEHPSYSEFKTWLGAKGYAHYLDFRSVGGSDYAAGRWLDEEFRQMWRD